MALRLAALLALLTGVVSACQKGPELVVVAVDVVDRSQGLGIDREALASRLKTQLEGQGLRVRPARGQQVPHQARLVVGVASTQPVAGGLRRTVALELSLRPLQGPHSVLQVSALGRSEGPPASGTPDPGMVEAFEHALKQAGSRLQALCGLREAGDEKVVGALTAEDPAQQAAALAEVRRRRLASAVPRLAQMVQDPAAADPLVLEAVGALVDIGDPSAAGALVDAASSRAPHMLPQIIFALGELGGREAEAYLFTLRQGHPNPAIRDAADQALKEMGARAERSAAPDSVPP